MTDLTLQRMNHMMQLSLVNMDLTESTKLNDAIGALLDSFSLTGIHFNYCHFQKLVLTALS